MRDTERLEKAYAAAGMLGVYVCEISPGRYQVTKPRIQQTISHQELCREIDRLAIVSAGLGGKP
jgi:hypothetical protein